MIHLVSESFQTILFLFFFSLLLKLPRLSLLPSPLQHICPKLHPVQGAQRVRTSDLNSPSLPLPPPRPTLPIVPDTAGLRAVEGFMELPERSSSPIICFYLFLSPPHDSCSHSCPSLFSQPVSTPLCGINVSVSVCREMLSKWHQRGCFRRRILYFSRVT